ncbi:MAG: DUF1428 domain-containing protein, partial [Pseudomonadota bacterium]
VLVIMAIQGGIKPMTYVDVFLVAVPTAKKTQYLNHSKAMSPIMKDLGALSITECWGDDIPDGKLTSFPLAVKAQAHETVVVSMATWPSKAVRDAAWAKMMEDPQMNDTNMPMPFDGKRLILGGFEEIYRL